MSYGYTSHDTQRWLSEGIKSTTRTDFERDRGRVLHSAALRRLGAKTQVMGPESDDFIRTRLTHSLEVAQIGRSLAKNLGADQDVVETACLCHDLGHPPYGHNGEKALDELAQSFGGFEGNAQTLRILTRLEPKRFHPDGSPAGLNLTRAIVDATVKYPWTRFAGPAGQASPKFGAYDDDVPAFVWAHEDHGRLRSAEAQMMDLADDIAYSVHDLEDGIFSGYIPLSQLSLHNDKEIADVVDSTLAWYRSSVSADELAQAGHRVLQMVAWPAHYTGSQRDIAKLKDYTSDLIGRFVSAVTLATRQEHPQPLLRYSGDVVVPHDTALEILFVKGIAVHYVMAPREQEASYFEQRTLLFDLMDALVEDPVGRMEPMFVKLWKRAEDENARLRVIIDQIASLTDQSARVWHARYCGMLRH
ncbi:deoxyguanosinetriphosphate triphosphohydrolase [Arcanobacterium pinnipediorum]|uniref:Deoxyguanosinetriphosphate triphosphohydrolase-like protein n=1 Tax=Arcanobacterium pinnipediorum TaxID=1503041 RepID=A0ABY5AJV0_9ACTO|nr:deoxyguanosinetriphosphate triphosphohydrolase [Arcanobacterium pinnipediorum]USR80051.1 deoxyguanosinetriphosphate triphosphohydrolase [Arcanobacterium pinnipediorum]